MASSLQSLVSQNRKVLQKGPDGTLSESTQVPPGGTPPTISELAGQAGLPAPPTDAMSAAALGANPHQVKMQGSPAQVQSAVRQASAPQDQLSTQVRQTQARTQATEQEAGAKQKSADMQEMGGLGDRVTKFIDGQRQKLAATQVQATDTQVVTPTSYSLPSDPNAVAAVKDAAKALLANPKDMQALLTLNKSLGKAPEQTITPEELKQLYEDSTSTLSRSGAQVVQDKLQVEDLVGQAGFGYDLPTLSHLLNVPADQLAKYTMTQLRQAIDAENQQEFSKSAQLQQQAQSNVLGSAEKAQANALGKEASATGIRASEADFAHMDQQIQNADQVQFGGQTYQVDQLLQDETISGIIKQFLDNPNSAASQQLARTEPGLLQFIQKNQAVLSDASAAMAAGAQQFQGIQTANAGLGKVGSTTLDPTLMRNIVPGFGELSATKLDPSSSAFFQNLQKLPPGQQEAAATEANALAAGHPDVAKQFASLTPEQLQKLQLEKADTSPALIRYNNNVGARKVLDSLSPDNAAAVLAAASGKSDLTPGKLQSILDVGTEAKALGLGSIDNSYYESTPGIAIDSKALYDRLQKVTPPATLADAADGKAQNFTQVAPKEFQPTNGVQATVLQKLGKAALDGKITPDEVRTSGLTEGDLYGILQSGTNSKWSGGGGQTVSDMLNSMRLGHTRDILEQLPPIPEIPSHLPPYSDDALKQAQDTDQSLLNNIQSLQALVDKWKASPHPAGQEAGIDIDSLAQRLSAAKAAETGYAAEIKGLQTTKTNSDAAAQAAADLKMRQDAGIAKEHKEDIGNQLSETAKSAKDLNGGVLSGNNKDMKNGASTGFKSGGQTAVNVAKKIGSKLKFK